MPTRKAKQEPLPEVTEEAQVDAAIERAQDRALGFDRHYPQWTCSFRASLGDWTAQFTIADGIVNAMDVSDLDALESLMGLLEGAGWEACNAPDHPHAKSSSAAWRDQGADTPQGVDFSRMKNMPRSSTYAGANTKRDFNPRDDGWRDDPASDAQIAQLIKLKSTAARKRGLTKGEASDLLSEYFDRS